MEAVTWSDRQTKSAPCGTDRSLTDSDITSSLGSDLRTNNSSYFTSSLSARSSESTDTDSVTRSAPGDWSTYSSSPATSDPEDRLFYSFPYTGKVNGDETEPEDYSECSFSRSRSYGDYESKENSTQSAISTASSSTETKEEPSVKIFSPLQLDRWRQWRKDHGLDLVNDEDSVGSRSEDSSSEDEDSDLGGINGSESSKQYKARILKRLLAEFDSQQTIRYYRSLNSVSYQFDPNEFSLDW